MNSNIEPSFYREYYLELLDLARNFKLVEFQKNLSETYEKLGTESFIIEFITICKFCWAFLGERGHIYCE